MVKGGPSPHPLPTTVYNREYRFYGVLAYYDATHSTLHQYYNILLSILLYYNILITILFDKDRSINIKRYCTLLNWYYYLLWYDLQNPYVINNNYYYYLYIYYYYTQSFSGTQLTAYTHTLRGLWYLITIICHYIKIYYNIIIYTQMYHFTITTFMNNIPMITNDRRMSWRGPVVRCGAV